MLPTNIYYIIYTQYDMKISLVQWGIFIMWGWHMKYYCILHMKIWRYILYMMSEHKKTRFHNVYHAIWTDTLGSLFYMYRFKVVYRLSNYILWADNTPNNSFLLDSVVTNTSNMHRIAFIQLFILKWVCFLRDHAMK